MKNNCKKTCICKIYFVSLYQNLKLIVMIITKNIFINWNNPVEEFTVGIHSEKTFATWIAEEKNESELEQEDFEEMNRLILGFLFFNITILY